MIRGVLTPTNRCHFWGGSHSWSPPLAMSSSRAWAASVLSQGQVVIMGGIDQNNVTLDSIEVIDIKTRKSKKLELSLPSPLAGHCAVQLNSSHIFVAGGAGDGLAGFAEPADYSSKAWVVGGGVWSHAGNMHHPRSLHSCSLLGGVEVVVAGGVGLDKVGTRTVLDTVEIYNTVTGRWRKAGSLPSPVFGAGLLQLSGQIVMIGGRQEQGGQLLQTGGLVMYQQEEWEESSSLALESPRDLAVTLHAPSFC